MHSPYSRATVVLLRCLLRRTLLLLQKRSKAARLGGVPQWSCSPPNYAHWGKPWRYCDQRPHIAAPPCCEPCSDRRAQRMRVRVRVGVCVFVCACACVCVSLDPKRMLRKKESDECGLPSHDIPPGTVPNGCAHLHALAAARRRQRSCSYPVGPPVRTLHDEPARAGGPVRCVSTGYP
jgi:hypothetical protein